MDEIFKYDYWNEYYREVLSCGGIYFAVQRSEIWPLNWKLQCPVALLKSKTMVFRFRQT